MSFSRSNGPLRLVRAFVLPFALLLSLGLGAPALAQRSALNQVVSQLEAQGFAIEKVETTFLRRTRVIARSDRHVRELVFNPNTGEILRDYWQETTSQARSGRAGGTRDDDEAGRDETVGSRSLSGGPNDDDDDDQGIAGGDDDDGDDDDDDDGDDDDGDDGGDGDDD